MQSPILDFLTIPLLILTLHAVRSPARILLWWLRSELGSHDALTRILSNLRLWKMFHIQQTSTKHFEKVSVFRTLLDFAFPSRFAVRHQC